MSDYFREAFGCQDSQDMSLDGGPAFPIKEHLDSDWSGMTLRDYFAAKAMHGLIASARDFTTDADASKPITSWDDYARGAYQMADAMLKARGN